MKISFNEFKTYYNLSSLQNDVTTNHSTYLKKQIIKHIHKYFSFKVYKN